MQDVKTLRLASLQLTTDSLQEYLRYQRALLKALAASREREWAGRFAFAHGTAMQQAKLDLHSLQKVKAVVADYCGKRTAVQQVKERLEEAKRAVETARGKGREASKKDLQVIERAGKELPGLESEHELEARYGAEAMTLLRAHQAELVTLHRDLSRAEGEQHLHRA
jgi:hypothetical protein